MPVSNAEVSVDEEEDNEQNERENDNNNNNNKSKKKKKEPKGNRFLNPFVSGAKKRIVSKIRRTPLSPSPPSASSGFWQKVCFCGIESSNTLAWSSSSNPDPEGGNFTLRVLLQTNDFFSNDSNPHL